MSDPHPDPSIEQCLDLADRLGTVPVRTDPFPYVYLPEAIDPEWSRRLTREFPSLSDFTRGATYPENFKLFRRLPDLLKDPRLSPAWRWFVRTQSDGTAIERFFSKFATQIGKHFPDLEDRLGPVPFDRLKRRGEAATSESEWQFDAEAVIHTPAQGEVGKSERPPHWKGTNKLLEAHLFLSSQTDDGEPDGEVVLYRLRPGCRPRCGPRNVVENADLEVVRNLPCVAGSLFLFLNTPDTITEIVRRQPRSGPFQYFAMPLQAPDYLFDLPTT